MWIVIVKECANCGGDYAVKLFEDKPTDEEVKDVELGSGQCLKTAVFEMTEGEITYGAENKTESIC